MFRPNGAIYLAPLAITIENGSLVPPNAHALTMSREDSIDIDEQSDVMLAELVLQARS
jgi:CMP-N-acetylneuraminic acid synthetase